MAKYKVEYIVYKHSPFASFLSYLAFPIYVIGILVSVAGFAALIASPSLASFLLLLAGIGTIAANTLSLMFLQPWLAEKGQKRYIEKLRTNRKDIVSIASKIFDEARLSISPELQAQFDSSKMRSRLDKILQPEETLAGHDIREKAGLKRAIIARWLMASAFDEYADLDRSLPSEVSPQVLAKYETDFAIISRCIEICAEQRYIQQDIADMYQARLKSIQNKLHGIPIIDTSAPPLVPAPPLSSSTDEAAKDLADIMMLIQESASYVMSARADAGLPCSANWKVSYFSFFTFLFRRFEMISDTEQYTAFAIYSLHIANETGLSDSEALGIMEYLYSQFERADSSPSSLMSTCLFLVEMLNNSDATDEEIDRSLSAVAPAVSEVLRTICDA